MAPEDRPHALEREVLTFLPAGGARGHGRPRLRFYDNEADLKVHGHDIIKKNTRTVLGAGQRSC